MTVKHKPKKDHIVPDTLSRLASSNINLPAADPKYAKLDTFFAYLATLVESHPNLLKKILKKYQRDEW